MDNLTEFKELIAKYNSITLIDLKKVTQGYQARNFEDIGAETVISELTGFGSQLTCSLCIAVTGSTIYSDPDCNACVWKMTTKDNCHSGINTDSYCSIQDAIDNNDLLEAIKLRAEYMKEVLSEYLKDSESL